VLGLQLMLFFHEISHLVVASLLGVELTFIDIFPGKISSMITVPNPYDSVIVWAGILLGSVLPFALIPIWNTKSLQAGTFFKLWAYFCVLANGSYLSLGFWESLSDSGKLIGFGWPVWSIIGIGIVIAAIGYVCIRSTILRLRESDQLSEIDFLSLSIWGAFLLAWIGFQYWIAVLLS